MKLKNVKSKLNRKQKAFSSGKGTPSYKEGSNGDITVRNISGKGLFLYYKYQGKWYSTRLNKINPKYAEDKESVVIPKGRKPRKSGELTLDTSNKMQLCKKVISGEERKTQVPTMNSSNILDITEIQTKRTSTTGMGTDNGGTSDFKLVNTTGHSYMHIETQGSSYDPYIMFAYRQVGESEALKQWTIGMDNSATDTLKFHYKGSGTAPLTPSSTAGGGSADSVMELTNSGALSVSGTVTSSNGVCGGPAVTNHVTNNADDTMAGTLTIDKDTTATTTGSTYGLNIDYDHTGISASGQSTRNYGISSAINSDSPTHVGSVLNFGINSTVTAGTSGTQSSIGINNTVTGADTNTGIYQKVTDGGNDLKFVSSANSSNMFTLSTGTNAATILETTDAVGANADLTLDPDGELILTPVTEVQSDAPLKIKESADAVADTAGYGQIWVDTATPNELAFTDDAGTDIIGVGKYHYETKFIGFYAGQTAQYIPMTGYIIEKTSTGSSNEFISFVAPYNCTIEKFIYRSEVAQDGTFSLRVLESSDNTEVPSLVIYRKDTTIDIADDTFLDYDLTSPGTGSDYAPLTKGKIYAIYVATPAVGYDTNITVVFKWDITS